MTRPEKDCVYVQDATGGMVREGYWYLARAGLRGWSDGGHAHPEWAIEVIPGSIDVYYENVDGDSCELLGLVCGVFYHPGGADRDHAPPYLCFDWAPNDGCDRQHYSEAHT